MLRRLSTVSFVLTALLVTQVAHAQATTKKPGFLTRGTVLLADGEPWADARVVLVARPNADEPAFDRHEVRTDERGRFRVRLLPNLSYRAWSMTEADEKGLYRSTNIASCKAGTRVELKELKSRCVRIHVRMPVIEGVAAKDLRLRVSGNPIAVADADLVPEDDLVLLPALPGPYVSVDAYDASGHLRASKRIKTTSKARNSKLGGSTPMSLSERKTRTHKMWFRILDAQRKPVKGARLTPLLSGGSADDFSLPYVSDEEGWVRFDHRSNNMRTSSWQVANCLIDAPGQKRARLDLMYQVIPKGNEAKNKHQLMIQEGRNFEDVRKKGKADRDWIMQPGHAVRGRLMLADGKPAAGITLHCTFSPHRVNPSTTTSFSKAHWPLLTKTGDDGSFAFDGVGGDFTLTAILTREAHTAIGAPRAHPHVHLAHGKATKDFDLGDVRLDELTQVSIRVRTAGGEAARFAPILIAKDDRDIFTRFDCDRLGRLDLLLPSEGEYEVASRYTTSVIEKKIKLTAGENVVVLGKPRVIFGKITNAKGTPLPGAHVYFHAWSGPSNRSLLSRLPQTQVKSAADGTYRVPIASGTRQGQVTANYQHGKRWFHSSGNRGAIQLGGDDDIEHDLVIEAAPDPAK